MVPTSFPGVTEFLGAPKGWDPDGPRGECDPLPIMRNSDGLTSMWIPDRDELAALNTGAAVQLTIMTSAHPVVAVGVSAFPAPSQKQE